MHRKVIEQILKIMPKKIIYIGCKSATQARDTAFIKDFHKIVKIQPIDIFPNTQYIENVVLLETNN